LYASLFIRNGFRCPVPSRLSDGQEQRLAVALLIGTGLNHVRLTFGGFLFSSIPLLVYGLLLGSIA